MTADNVIQFVPGLNKPGTKLDVPHRIFWVGPCGLKELDAKEADTSPSEYAADSGDCA